MSKLTEMNKKQRKQRLKELSHIVIQKMLMGGDYCEVFNKRSESKGYYYFYRERNNTKYFTKDLEVAVQEISYLFGARKSTTFKYCKVIQKIGLYSLFDEENSTLAISQTDGKGGKKANEAIYNLSEYEVKALKISDNRSLYFVRYIKDGNYDPLAFKKVER